MDSDKPVTVTIEMDDRTAWALAQFVKRIGWKEIRDNAESDDDAYNMREGIGRLQEALARSGYSPR